VTDVTASLLADALRDRYTLERELGRGGMATVYLARDVRHKRPVALKVLHPELAQTLGPERFQREIELAARLQHPHILTVHDSGEAAGQLWFTMPYVEGESLRDRLRQERQLPVDEALRIATETARALDYAHRQGVVHRDIKPENILLTKDGDTLVADFGIARALGAADSQKLTETGMALGTPAYMSPEQAAGDRQLDARTDVYALGAVLYEMLAGEPPFTGPTAQAMIAKRFSGEVPRVRQVRPSVPEALEQTILRALAPVAADRFATAADLARALASSSTPAAPSTMPAATATAPSAVPVAAPALPRRRRPVPIAAITLALGFLVGLGVLFAWRHGHPAPEGAAGAAPKRIAVLPFDNLGDSADAYFADGVTDEVRGKLASLPGLQVTASNSSSEYKKTTKTPQQIGQELGVQYLLVGKVRWEKVRGGTSRVRVSPELVQVTTASTKWQQPFEASLTDVFQVQADIASRVAQALGLALGAGERAQLSDKPTQNLAAYDAYLRGEEISSRFAVTDPVTLRRAAASYEEAVALDTAFALAWARLSEAHSLIYVGGFPDPKEGEAARVAAERAVALAPNRPEGHSALGRYYRLVRRDYDRALEAYAQGEQLAPANADLLRGTGLAEQALSRWEPALAHLRQAQTLDPRSASVADALATCLLWLRRYPEAMAASERALAVAPASLTVREDRAMLSLAQGDLAGAQAVFRAVPKEIEPSTLVAYVANYWDLYWALDDGQQQLLVHLTPEPFDNNRAAWGISLAETYAVRGDQLKARAYADSARAAFEEQLQATPNDAQLHAIHGLALAYLGRKAEAVGEGQRALALLPITKDASQGSYDQHQLARIYLLVGEPEKALNELEPLLKIPYYLSPGWLKIDPTFNPLRGNPRFERLVAGK